MLTSIEINKGTINIIKNTIIDKDIRRLTKINRLTKFKEKEMVEDHLRGINGHIFSTTYTLTQREKEHIIRDYDNRVAKIKKTKIRRIIADNYSMLPLTRNRSTNDYVKQKLGYLRVNMLITKCIDKVAAKEMTKGDAMMKIYNEVFKANAKEGLIYRHILDNYNNVVRDFIAIYNRKKTTKQVKHMLNISARPILKDYSKKKKITIIPDQPWVRPTNEIGNISRYAPTRARVFNRDDDRAVQS